MLNLEKKVILVLGAGKSGISTVKFLLEKNPLKIILSDVKSKSKLPDEVFEFEKKGVLIESDGHKDSSIMEADIVIVSPGVPVLNQWRDLIRRHNKILLGEIELAYQFCNSKIIAVTGTNGKTTTVKLIYEILKDQMGDKVALAGNVGIPFIEVISKKSNYDYIVLEVSSFQLETIIDFKPVIGIILNITEDHLDRYKSMQEYAEAKANIFKNQNENDFIILNYEDKFTPILSGMAKSNKILFSAYRELNDGYYFKKGIFYKNVFGKKEEILDANEIKLKGNHNYENVLSSLIVSDILKLDFEKTKNTVKNFKGLPHRIEFVAEINGKKYYDDSKGTNIDAVIKAIDTFSENTALILGGREKNTDFSYLFRILPSHIKVIIAIGENKEKIENIFSNKVKVIKAETMDDAVRKASEIDNIDVILLSPGCASFDMFKNYEHRGEEFKKSVFRLVKNGK
jgi:UDP-N-acetylmuramoylalanine--D-glutamate ligase